LTLSKQEHQEKANAELRARNDGFSDEIAGYKRTVQDLKNEIRDLKLFEINQENIEKENINLQSIVNHTRWFLKM